MLAKQWICDSQPLNYIAQSIESRVLGRPPQPTQEPCAALCSSQNMCTALPATCQAPVSRCRLSNPLLDVLPLQAPRFLERVGVILRGRASSANGEHVSVELHCTCRGLDSTAHLVAEHEVHVMSAVLNEDGYDRVVDVLHTPHCHAGR